MDHLTLCRTLGIPEHTPSKRTNAVVLRTICAGGAELLDAKEWASGIAHSSRDATAKKLAGEVMARLVNIQRAMLGALEEDHKLPPGTLTDYL